jgi:outer membrane protein OmpA-like peptidoglycan-associated protein
MAGFVLTAFLLAAAGIRLFFFEEKPEIVVKSVFQDPASLYFEAGSTRLSANDFAFLDGVAELLIQNSRNRAVIKGYTDSKGTASLNMSISVARAEAVKDYLVQKGVAPYRIQAIGMGSQQPASGANHDKFSRRVVIEIDSGKNGLK